MELLKPAKAIIPLPQPSPESVLRADLSILAKCEESLV